MGVYFYTCEVNRAVDQWHSFNQQGPVPSSFLAFLLLISHAFCIIIAREAVGLPAL
jgi:hypothetical protein